MVSLNDVTPGSSADSSCIQQVVDAWKGTAGKGVPLSVTAVNDSANFAVDVRNQDANNGRGLRVRDSSNSVQIQSDVNGVQINQVNISSGTITGSTFTGGSIKNSTFDHTSGVPVRLSNQTLTSSAGVIDFTAISTSYAHLEVWLYARTESDGGSSVSGVRLRFNADASTIYAGQLLTSTGTTVAASASTGQTSGRIGVVSGSSATAGLFGHVRISIPYYQSTGAKLATGMSIAPISMTGSGVTQDQSVIVWNSTAAVNNVTLIPVAGAFSAGSRATLYGLP